MNKEQIKELTISVKTEYTSLVKSIILHCNKYKKSFPELFFGYYVYVRKDSQSITYELGVHLSESASIQISLNQKSMYFNIKHEYNEDVNGQSDCSIRKIKSDSDKLFKLISELKSMIS